MDRYPSRYLVDVVTLHVLTDHDEYGSPVYADPASYSARVIYQDKSVMTKTGQLVHERGMVLIDGIPPPTVKVEDKLVLPGGETPSLMEAALVRDAEGVPHHSRVTFG